MKAEIVVKTPPGFRRLKHNEIVKVGDWNVFRYGSEHWTKIKGIDKGTKANDIPGLIFIRKVKP